MREFADTAVENYPVEFIDNGIDEITKEADLQWCHEFLHYAGWSLYKRQQNMYEAFFISSEKCDSGMYHGIAEAFIKDKSQGRGVKEFIEKEASNACISGFDSRKDPKAMVAHCHHGMGHAFMYMTDNDLNRSLAYCDMVQSGLGSCYTGAFMENIQRKQVDSGSFHQVKYGFNDEDPDFPCNILDDKYKEFCYHYKGVSNVVQTKGDFRRSFQDCQLVDKKYQKDCFRGVGSNIPGPHWSSATAGKKCDEALYTSEVAYEQCVIGGVGFLMQINKGEIQAAIDYCNEITPSYQGLCMKEAGLNISQWLSFGENAKSKCNQIENTTFRNYCLSSFKDGEN